MKETAIVKWIKSWGNEGLNSKTNKERISRELRRVISYSLVGGSGVLISMALLWALVEYAHLFYLVAAIISTTLGITNNFFLYEKWTFRDVKRQFTLKKLSGRWLQYSFVRLMGMGIGLAILTGLVEGLGMHYFIANTIGIIVSIIFNYFLSIGWIWKSNTPTNKQF